MVVAVVVVPAGAVLAVLVVMPVLVLMLMVMLVLMLMLMFMLVLMLVRMLMLVLVMMVLVVVVVGLRQILNGQQEARVLDGFQHLRAVQLVPRRGDDAGARVVAAQQRHALFDPLLRGRLGAAEYDGLGALDLVDEELAEVVRVHAAFAHVRHGGAARQLDRVGLGHVVHHAADVAQLAHARGLDQYAVGVVGVDQLAQRLGEVAHQRAADAAGVQLRDLHARLLHKAAVDADLAVLVFQQHHLFALEGAVQQLLDQRGLARAEEAGNDVDLGHCLSPVL